VNIEKIFSELIKNSPEEQFLQGKLLRIPTALKYAVEKFNFRVEKKELAYLIWSTIKGTKPDPKTGWRRIHHKRFDFKSGHKTNAAVLQWLEENKFILVNKSYRNDKDNGFPRGYCLINKSQTELVELQNKSLVDNLNCFTQIDPACKHTRDFLDFLQVDREAIKVDLQNLLRYDEKKPKTVKKNKKKTENLDVAVGLLQIGQPVFELVNKSGRIKRGPKGNRLYNPFVRLKKSLRRFFTYEGEPLVYFDMQAAHPCLLGNFSQDERLVQDCCDDGDSFYQGLLNNLGTDRDTAKRRYNAWAYDQIREKSKVGQYMIDYYPAAATWVNENKKGQNGNKKFCWEMQKKEAEIFVDGIYLAICDKGIPAITIHDGIATLEKNKKQVETIIQTEIKRRDLKIKIKQQFF